MKIVSLFCGVGGFDLGFINAGHQIIWANDFDKDACKTYKHNIGDHIICDDIKNIKNDDIPDDFDMLLGGFPCQGFSISNKNRSIKDTRNYLYLEILRVLESKRPKYFLLENVTGILSLAKGKIFENILKDLKNLNYQVEYFIFDASNFGIAQKRKRVFIFGFLEEKINIHLEISNKKITLRDAIKHLSKIKCQNHPIIDADKIIYNHIAKTNVNDIFYCRKYHVDQQKICNYLKKYKTMSTKKIDDHFGYKHTAAHWFRCDHFGSLPSANEWFELKKLFKFDDTYDEAMTTYVQKNLTYEQNLRVAKWNEPSATILASTPQIHPNKKRRLSVRECAIVQSFPDNFMFFGSITSMHKQVGNAVPPKLAYQIALNYNNIL